MTSKSSALQLLLIDELDEVLSFKSEHFAILSALLRATAQVNESLADMGVNAKIVLFIRTDMLDKLDYPNKQKVVAGMAKNCHGIKKVFNRKIPTLSDFSTLGHHYLQAQR